MCYSCYYITFTLQNQNEAINVDVFCSFFSHFPTHQPFRNHSSVKYRYMYIHCLISIALLCLQFKGRVVCECLLTQRAGLRSRGQMASGEQFAVIFGKFYHHCHFLVPPVAFHFRWNNHFGAENLCRDMGQQIVIIEKRKVV